MLDVGLGKEGVVQAMVQEATHDNEVNENVEPCNACYHQSSRIEVIALSGICPDSPGIWTYLKKETATNLFSGKQFLGATDTCTNATYIDGHL